MELQRRALVDPLVERHRAVLLASLLLAAIAADVVALAVMLPIEPVATDASSFAAEMLLVLAKGLAVFTGVFYVLALAGALVARALDGGHSRDLFRQVVAEHAAPAG
jgi:hypothetical protein